MSFSAPIAFLLQAAAEEVVEAAPEATEMASSAVDQSTLLSLLFEAGPVGKFVMLLLVVMSMFSWAIAFSKYGGLSAARKKNLTFLKAFRRVGKLADMNAASEQYRPAPLVTVFDYGYEEVARQVNTHGRIVNADSIDRALSLATSEESSRLQQGLSLLATTASSAPFIGLFGTVWGVLQAFRGLGQAGGATLRAVAPGIAEALIATAFGLFAAIPALIFYNIFSSQLREIRTRMNDFGLEFFNLAERDYGEGDGVSDAKQRSIR